MNLISSLSGIFSVYLLGLMLSAMFHLFSVHTPGNANMAELALADRLLSAAHGTPQYSEVNSTIADHPMLQRSNNILQSPAAGATGGNANVNSAVNRLQEMILPMGGTAGTNASNTARIVFSSPSAGNYRFLIGAPRHRAIAGLHRQGAVRRWHHIPVDNNNDFFQR